NKSDPFQHWPNTMSDALCAYLVYQHWGNVGGRGDEQTSILRAATQTGRDALPELRALMRPNITRTPSALRWYYQLPMDSPAFLVADMRTRKTLPAAAPGQATPDWETRELDSAQLAWLESALRASKGPAAFVVLSTPLLMPRFTTVTMNHLAGLAFIQGEADGGSIAGKVFSAMLGASEYLNTVNFYQDLDSWDETKPHLHELEKGGSALDDVGRRRRDFEHMNMDRTWDDITGMVGRLKRSSLKTIVLVSGDVHHNFALLGKI